MLGGQGVFFVAQQLFVELFARAQAGVLDLDFGIGLVTGQFYHAPGQLADLDGGAHVEDKDFAVVAHGGSLQHQAAGFGDGHKKAGNLGMGHRHRPAFFDLLAKTGHHRAVRSQHIAKTGGDVAGAAGGVAFGYMQTQALDKNLGQTLAGPHDIGRIDSFVGGDHDHFFGAIPQSGFGYIDAAPHVHLYGFAGVFFHQGHMLVGRGMKDHLGRVLFKKFIHPLRYSYVSYYRDQL